MIEVFDILYAQCVGATPEPLLNALQVVFNCAIEAAKEIRSGADLGYNVLKTKDIELIQQVPFMRMSGLDQTHLLDSQVMATLSERFENVGLRWGATVVDGYLSDVELLQPILLETGEYLISQGVDITTFQPNGLHMSVARDAMHALGITSNTFADIQISKRMDFESFERLLAMTNMVFKNDAEAISNWASNILKDTN